MSEAVAKTIIKRDYKCGPVVVDGKPYGYLEGFGWIRADVRRCDVEVPLKLKRWMNAKYWDKVGQSEVSADVPLVTMDDITYGWSAGFWMVAEPNLPARPVRFLEAQQLTENHKELIRDYFFIKTSRVELNGFDYGIKIGGGWYGWDNLTLVESGYKVRGLNRLLEKKMLNASKVRVAVGKHKKSHNPRSAGRYPTMEIIE